MLAVTRQRPLLIAPLTLVAAVAATTPVTTRAPAIVHQGAWVRFTTENSDLPDDKASVILATDSETVWVGTERGLARLRRGQWDVFKRTNSALPSETVTALASLSDGVIWIGTDRGLARFHENRWDAFDTSNSKLPGNHVGALAATKDGALWIGVEGFVVRHAGDKWDVFGPDATGLEQDVTAIVVARDGHVWAGAGLGRDALRGLGNALRESEGKVRGGGLARFDGNRWQLFVAPDTLPDNNVKAIALGDADDLWIATSRGVTRFHANHWQVVADRSRHDVWVVNAITTAGNTVWIANFGNLSQLRGEEWSDFAPSAETLPGNEIQSLSVAPDGAIWIATDGGGILRFRPQVSLFSVASGNLRSDLVRALAVGPDRSVWIGLLNGGLTQMNGGTWRSFTKENSGLPDDSVMSIVPTAEGVWVATGAGLAFYDGRAWKIFTVRNSGLPGDSVNDVAVDASGVVWVFTNGGFARFDGGAWREVPQERRGTVPEGFPTGVYTSDGARWALRVGGGLTRRRQNRFEEFTPEQTGFPADRLEQIATAPDGSAWAAYENGSLLRFDGRDWQLFTADNAGLPRERPGALVVDAAGTLWLGTLGGGLARFEPPKERPKITDLSGRINPVTQTQHTFGVIAFDPNYRTRPEEFRYEWSSGRRSRTLFTGQRETTTSRAAIRAFPFDADGDYFIEVTAIDRYGYRSQPARHEFRVVLPAPSSSGLVRGVITAVVGSGILYFLLLFPIIALYARIDLARTAVGSGWFTKFPLLHKTILNSRWSRRHIFRSYAQAIAGDASKHLPPHYVSQSIDLPDDSGELTIDVTQASTSLPVVLQRLFGSEKRVMVLGRSGTGKSVFLRSLELAAVRQYSQRGDGRIPVFLDLKTNPLKGRQVEDLVLDVLAGRRVELPPDVVRFMLRRGGFLLLIDSLDEIDEQSRDDGLQPFLVRDADNWCVFAAQQPLLARAQVRLARVLAFTPARARAYLRKRLGEDMWDRLPEAAQTIAKVPKDLDLIADLLRSGQPEAIPTDRAGLYRQLLERDSIVGRWAEAFDDRARAIYAVAFRMLNENVRSLDAQTLPQWVDESLNAVNPSASPAIATQTMEAVRKSSMFTEEETLVAGALRRVTVFQHELIGKYLAARHLRTFLGPPVASTLVEAANVGRLREVFQFLIDELEGTQLNNLLSAVVTEGGDARLRVAAYALDVKPEQVTPEVRDAYLTASVIEAVRKT